MDRREGPSPFAALVNQYLYERNLSQKWLAAAVGIAPDSLSRLMRGRRHPRADLVLAIANVLELEANDQKRLLEAAGYPSDDRPSLATPLRRQSPRPSLSRGAHSPSRRDDPESLARHGTEASASPLLHTLLAWDTDGADQGEALAEDPPGDDLDRVLASYDLPPAIRTFVRRLAIAQITATCAFLEQSLRAQSSTVRDE